MARMKREQCLKKLQQNTFLLLLFIGTVCGYVVGFLLRSQNLSNHTIHLIGFPGQLVLRALLMIIVPLLFCSLVLGVSSLRKGGDARMVAITIAFFLGLSTFSAVMGATAGHLVHPGRKITSGSIHAQSQLSGSKGVILDSILDLIWNTLPSNIIEATFKTEFTHVEVLNLTGNEDNTLQTPPSNYIRTIRKKDGVNFMGLLCFSVLFGCALASLGEKGDALHQVIDQLNDVTMRIMDYFLNLLPLGMFFWMIREGLERQVSVETLGYVGIYLCTVMGGILFHQLVLLPLLYLLIVRRNPVSFHLTVLPVLLTAFGTCSSAATLPRTLRCAEETNHLNRCVTRFVLPLGMIVHMNGGSFYIPLASIFLAQLEGVDMGISETIVICLTSVLLFIAAPATAGSGSLVYLLTVMAAIGISTPQYVSLFLSMEWFMERFRTVMNVVGDIYVAAFVDKLCGRTLPRDYHDVEYPVDSHNQPTVVLVSRELTKN